MLRLNVAVKPAPPTWGQRQRRLGVLNGDLAGFPNGRRLEDDVTDIELRAVADGYGSFLNTNFGLPNLSPNNTVGDGVNENDMPFLSHSHMSRSHGAATTWASAPSIIQLARRTPGR